MTNLVIDIIALFGFSIVLLINSNGRNFLLYLLIILTIPLAVSTQAITIYEVLFLTIFTILSIASFGSYAAFDIDFKGSRKVLISCLGFLIALFISVNVAILSGTSFITALRAAYPFGLLSLLFFVSLNINYDHRKILMWALVSAGAVISLKCILFIVQEGYLFQNPLIGESGTPFNSALYLFVLPFPLVMLFLTEKKSNRIILFLFLFIISWRFLIGFRRQPLFIFFLSLILIIYFLRYQKNHFSYFKTKFYLLSPFLFLALITFLFFNLYTILNSVALGSLMDRLSYQSILLGLESRFSISIKAWEYFLSNPLLGIGIGKKVELYSYVDQSFLRGASQFYRLNEVSKVHNLYLYILMNGGLLLFIPFVIFIHRIFKMNKILLKKFQLEKWDLFWCIGNIVFLINFLILGFFSVKTISLEAWLIVGIVSGMTIKIFNNYNQKLEFK